MLREITVSGLREFLAGLQVSVPVSQLAKWKTTAQMVAIAVLFAQGVFEHYFGMSVFGMDDHLVLSILEGREDDLHGLTWKYTGMVWAGHVGIWLLWLAAALTLLTGFDYFNKSIPYLKDER